MVAVCVRVPLVPVTVKVKFPTGVVVEVVMVNVEEPAPLMEAGTNPPDVAAGSPSKLRATTPVKAPNAVVETV
jgi:hypothetical protein